LARRRQKRELLGEELRLLYVAMTRARDLLVLTAGVPQAEFEDSWQTPGEPTAEALAGAASYADWLRLWFAKEIGATAATARQGDHAGVRWAIHDEAGLARVEPANAAEGDSESLDLTAPAAVWQQLEQRLTWKYAFDAATLRPAKASVSALRRRAAAMEGEESSLALGPQPASRGPRFRGSTGEPETKAGVIRPGANASAAEIGDAHHAFLEQVAIERTETIAGLKAEAQRLQERGALRAEETGLLDFGSLAGFWGSDLGARLRTQAQFVQRELPFTARFSPAELGRVTGEPDDLSLVGEFVVVQGVVDLAVLLPREIWLVDFKTDEARPRDLPAKVKLYGPQLKLYAQALAKIYQRPVSEAWLYFLGPREAVSVDLA
jgi:ATP-dependent helicase/nuclease subunit A